MDNQQFKEEFLITNIVVNGNNEGSLLSNKEFHICYAVVNNDLKQLNKKIIGCFLNPNDLLLDMSIDNNMFYFQIYLPLTKEFNISEILKYTIYSKNYSNHIVKTILRESDDVTVRKIITKCEEELKKKY
jgi:hypothetical protein